MVYKLRRLGLPPVTMSRSARSFSALARLAMHRRRVVLAGFLAVTVVAGLGAFPLNVEGDLVRLLPDDDPAVRALRAYRDAPGGEGAVMVTVPATADAQGVADRLRALPTVRDVFSGVGGEEGLKLRLLQLEPEQIEDLAESLHAAIVFNDPDLVRRPEPPRSLLPWAQRMLRDSDPDKAARPWTLIVIPAGPPGDPVLAQRLLQDLEAAVPEAVWMAGPHVTIGRSAREIRSDLARTSVLALVLIVAVISLAFRSLRATLLVFPPLLVGDLVALSVTQSIAGSLNFYTSAGSAILLGLGIDFAIHLVSRYREERASGQTPEAAIEATWGTTGPPCAIAGLTTAAGFFALLMTDFRGVSQLGLLLGVGVLACLALMLVVLPVLLLWLDPPPRRTGRLCFGEIRRPRLVIGAYLLLTIAVLAMLPRLEVEYDISQLREEGMAWDELTPEQQAYRETAFPPVVVTAQDRRATQVALQQRVDAGEWPHVRGVLSVDSLLPADQADHLRAIERLVRVANHHRLEKADIADDSELAILRDMSVTPLEIDDLPASLLQVLGAEHQRVYLLLQGNMADLREARALVRELADLREPAVNEFLAQASMIDLVLEDLPRMAVLVFCVVVLIVAFDLRRARPITIAAAGLLFSMAWAMAALIVADVRINLFNVVALPMMLGIGIDTVVHLLHRLRADDDTGQALNSTGWAALLSTVTSMAAFFALTLADNRGVASIGEAVVIGLAAVFLSAIVSVPAAWRSLYPRQAAES